MSSNTTGPVRVRFAPSPTGFLHLGGIRSAMFDWLLARQTGGKFILRLEDTDRERLVPGAAEAIMESLSWLGLDWDEGPDVGGAHGPYIQSERLESYRKYADELIAKGALYPCWCTPERLDTLRKEAQAKHQAFKYDRHCLTHPQSTDQPHVLRFRVPDDRGDISWKDAVRGEVSFAAQELDDFVAIKSDNFPTYNFAVVIDDHLMEITHVLRGDEFVPTTPKNILVYEALGWKPPVWVHLPQVLGPDKAKLSKRHGAEPALSYRDEGYLPDAVVNFLAALGWNEGEGSTREIYSRDELVQAFSLERIQRSPAVFDAERLKWMNGTYIRNLSPEQLLKHTEHYWPEAATEFDSAYKLNVLKLVQDRLKFLSELAELTEFFFADPEVDPELLIGKFEPEQADAYLEEVVFSLQDLEWTEQALEKRVREYAESAGVQTGQLFGLMRQALTGRKAAPGLFETMAVLGKTTSLARLISARDLLEV